MLVKYSGLMRHQAALVQPFLAALDANPVNLKTSRVIYDHTIIPVQYGRNQLQNFEFLCISSLDA